MERIGSCYTYRANRDHILWPAVDLIASAHRALDNCIRAEIAKWDIAPLSIEIFGSVAQGRSTKDSDIDLLVVSPHLEQSEQDVWNEQVDTLRDRVQSWTGNPCDIVVMDPTELAEAKIDDEPPLRSERVSVVGANIDRMMPTRAIAETLASVAAESLPSLREAVGIMQHSYVTNLVDRPESIFAGLLSNREFLGANAAITEAVAASLRGLTPPRTDINDPEPQRGER